ncbi:SDR family NAD(P)-dependent oxidoreductase [Streptomyces sp. NPDC048275]|uniref:SDR family NAD(P)-dependent oxidoreductase n=1 Tax=Streptomyces sp. NPDC048275 TaxID=3155629 RepID=UPI003402CB94
MISDTRHPRRPSPRPLERALRWSAARQRWSTDARPRRFSHQRCATGGAGAIGQVYGRPLAEAGASVVLADLNGEGAEQAAETLASDGLHALGVQVDITDRALMASLTGPDRTDALVPALE